jgi:RNA polymerase sigma-70 factor (ECF subfamily)
MRSTKNDLREAEDSVFAMTDSGTTTSPSGSSAHEQELLAAQNGDGDAFGRLVGQLQRELRAHCYRMLGSYADAEDALQETLLRAWRSLARFEGRSSFRSWLYRIATNACLRAIERRPKRMLPMDYAAAADPHGARGRPVNDPVWLEPYPDASLGLEGLAGPDARYEQRESIELAFIAALQHLPARQRAVLILRDVLGFSARETAAVLDTTPMSIDSALQRAHKTVDERLPSQAQQQTLRLLGDDELGRLIQRYVAAWERNDIDALVSMLTQDARIAMPPRPTWYSGREQVTAFVCRYLMTERTRWRLVPTSANGQPAVAAYLWVEQAGAFMPDCLHVLTLRGGEIEEIMAFRSHEVFPSFDLPASIAA